MRRTLICGCPGFTMPALLEGGFVVYAKRYAVPTITVCVDDASRATWVAR